MGFSRQEYWRSYRALLQGFFPTQGLNPHLLCLLHWQVGSLPLAPPGKPLLPPPFVKQIWINFQSLKDKGLYLKIQTLTDLKEKTDKSTIIVEDLTQWLLNKISEIRQSEKNIYSWLHLFQGWKWAKLIRGVHSQESGQEGGSCCWNWEEASAVWGQFYFLVGGWPHRCDHLCLLVGVGASPPWGVARSPSSPSVWPGDRALCPPLSRWEL